MTVLSWLHLTDLHQGMRDQDWLWPTMRGELFEDLAKVHKHAGPWDLVLFTGDLTQRGSPDEFKRLEYTLRELWAHFETLGSHPLLLAVPGNHDLVRPADADDPTVVALGDWIAKPKVREAFWKPASKYQELIRSAFAPYQAFWERVAHRPQAGIVDGLLPGDFSYVHEKDGARFGFLGLNSAFLQLTDADFDGLLAIDPRQAQPAVGGDLDRWASSCHAAFLLTHHPPTWLCPEARDLLDAEILPPRRFTAHLFGHMHEARARTIADGGEAPRREWQGTSLFGLEWLGEPSKQVLERRHGYTAGRITLDGATASIRQWPRRADRGQSRARHLGPDTSYLLENDVANVDEQARLRLPAPTAPVSPPARGEPSLTSQPGPSAVPHHAPGPRSHAWLAAALDCRLWDFVPAGSDAEQWRTAVQQIVDVCRSEWDAAGAALDDVWRDEDLPARVLRALELLLVDSRAGAALHAAEVALAVVAPFLREAAHASGVRWIAEGNPLSLDVEGGSTGPRAMLEREHEAQAPLVRRASRLAEQGREDDRRALALWMMHHCVSRDPALWELEPHGHLPPALRDRVQAIGEVAPSLRAALRWQRLRELSRCQFADPERIDREDRDDHLHDEEISNGISVRERVLAYALCLASWLAMDARRLPEVIIEHIGLSDMLTPAEVLQTLRDASWTRDRAGLALAVSCTHPAVDYALRHGVDRAMAVLDRIHRGAAEQRAWLQLLSSLPSRLTADGVTARLDAERRPVYQTPHIRFELAHDEVKELLMGEQLYTDPRLAIRELYQNALDACRYREARMAYLERRGGARLEPWQGEIQFRQGVSGGRAYIECEDNGVGMSLPEIEGCFAKAGRRFHDMPEFLEEQTEWLRVRPEVRLYPNSQFGVGVFSYFMLADEIEIETCRFNRDGSAGSVIRVYISGGGSLFRIAVGARGQDAGTRVRLHLGRMTYNDRRGKEKPISCLDFLNEVLHIAEYRTTCSEIGGERRAWNPGELSETYSVDAVQLDNDLWVTNNAKGLLLVDGIQVAGEQSHLVINLQKERRPRLTVDRKEVIAWSSEWIGDVLRSHWSKLVEWSPDFQTIWWLDANYPGVAVEIDRALTRPVVFKLSHWPSSDDHVEVPLDEVGWCAGDQFILEWLREFLYGSPLDRSPLTYGLIGTGTLVRRLPFEHVGSWAFIMQRVEQWVASGAIAGTALPKVRDHVQARGLELATFTRCIPEAGDWFVLGQWWGAPAGLVACAIVLEENLQRITKRLIKYAAFNVSPPSFDGTAGSFEPQPDDLIFLSRDADGRPPWLKQEPDLVDLLNAADALGCTVESIVPRYERFEFLGIRSPRISRLALEAALPKDDADRRLLDDVFYDAQGRRRIPFMSLLWAAAKARCSLGVLFDRVRAFEEVGVTIAPLDFVPTDCQCVHEDVVALEDVFPDEHGFALGPLLGAVMERKYLLRDTLRLGLLAITRRLGLLPATCSDQVIAGLRIDKLDVCVLSRDGDGLGPWIGRNVPRSHIAVVAKKKKCDEQDLVERVKRMTPLGVELIEGGTLQIL